MQPIDRSSASQRRVVVRIAGIVAVAWLLTSCFATQAVLPVGVAETPGFWKGLWHGLIAPIAFLVSLFSDHVRIYAMPHRGLWYDFGFMIGIGGFSHGAHRGGAAGNRRRRRRVDSKET
jgi:hypothetical protein